MKNVLKKLGAEDDNQNAIGMSANATNHNCTKHIDVRFHFICTCTSNEEFIFKYKPRTEMLAGIMTKVYH